MDDRIRTRDITRRNRSALLRPCPLVGPTFLRITSRALVIGLIVAVSGCAGPVENWIAGTRTRQGDIALAANNPADALLDYSLALRVDPHSAPARAGFVTASADEAQILYAHGEFDAGLATINAALRVDPSSVRLEALKTLIDNAKLKQEIVESNYPAYQHAGTLIRESYARLDEANALLIHSLRRFQYTYDVADLNAAIRQSYELQLELVRDTSRLIAYRSLVQSGAPQSVTAPATAGSLLPLP
jgi:tetratricopeptide (TPR) repeat protein